MAGLVEVCEDQPGLCRGLSPLQPVLLRCLFSVPSPGERVPGVAPRSHCYMKEGQRNGAGLFPCLDGCG